MRQINDIVIHCSDSPNGRNYREKDINQWHIDRGEWGPSPSGVYCGYHWVICIDGVIEAGRLPDEVGCHCPPNGHSLGICMVGKDRFTQVQWDSLKALIQGLKTQFPQATITGHYEHDSAKVQGKTCPNFDVPSYIVDFIPDDAHIL
jgi:hypothetical protein